MMWLQNDSAEGEVVLGIYQVQLPKMEGWGCNLLHGFWVPPAGIQGSSQSAEKLPDQEEEADLRASQHARNIHHGYIQRGAEEGVGINTEVMGEKAINIF